MRNQEKRRLRDMSIKELEPILTKLEKKRLDKTRRAKYIKYQLKLKRKGTPDAGKPRKGKKVNIP